MKLIAAVLLCLASNAFAGSVVYDHPALKTKLTVHTLPGQTRPDAISYEGPQGFYLIKESELSSLSRYDGWANWSYNVISFGADSISKQDVSYEKPRFAKYADDASVEAMQALIAALRGKGKEEAPAEFAARVAAMQRAASRTRGSYQSLNTFINSFHGVVLDPAVVAAQDAAISSAERSIAESAALRVTGEADAMRAPATASSPNPKAEFYWQQGLKLDKASSDLSSAQHALDGQTIPNY